MTTGSTIEGALPGYYRKRQWLGGDGGPGENTYSWSINEAYLPTVKYGLGTPRLVGSMNTFKPGFGYVAGASNDTLNRATAKVWEELTQSKFHGGVFAGEFRESYMMVVGAIRNIGRAYQAAKRGKWDRAFRLLSLSPNAARPGDVAANSYMMMHFGVMPLLSDIKAAYDFMLSSYKVVHHVKKAAGFKTSSTMIQSGVSWEYNYRCIAEIRGDVEMVELSLVDRLGLDEVFVVAWELSRLSWLIDWFLPIGNFLEAVNASNKTEGTKFFVTRMEQAGVYRPRNNGPYNIVPFYSDAFQTLYPDGPSNRRYSLSSLPWTFPTIKNPLGDNLSRYATSMALIRQTFRN